MAGNRPWLTDALLIVTAVGAITWGLATIPGPGTTGLSDEELERQMLQQRAHEMLSAR